MDPKDIIRSDKLLEFWPSARQTPRDRAAATARFVIYASVIVWLFNRDARVFALAGLVIAILYYLSSTNMLSSGARRPVWADGTQSSVFREPVTMPTIDNSMGNVLMTDYVDNPDRPAAAWYPSVKQEVTNEWARIHPFERRRDAERNFYTMPSTTIPNDQTGFAEASYGKKFPPMCKDGADFACDPDEWRFHFPERPQIRAGNGR